MINVQKDRHHGQYIYYYPLCNKCVLNDPSLNIFMTTIPSAILSKGFNAFYKLASSEDSKCLTCDKNTSVVMHSDYEKKDKDLHTFCHSCFKKIITARISHLYTFCDNHHRIVKDAECFECRKESSKNDLPELMDELNSFYDSGDIESLEESAKKLVSAIATIKLNA